MPAIANLLKFAAKTSWLAITRLLFFGAGGFLLNLALFLLLPNLCVNTGTSICAWRIAAAALLLLAFPVLYLLVGYKYTIQKVIHFAYVENKDFFYRYTVNKLADFLDRNKTTGNMVTGGAKLIVRFFDKLDNMPFAIRAVLRFISSLVPLADIVERATKEETITPDNEGKLAARIAEETDKFIGTQLLEPGLTLPALVLGANLAVFAALHLLF
ncbi:hypothetical protein C7N43_26400 [Sphingobacteriales bacterium UPWRP_1]|nr:hypothetical protein B6N25_16255 [Sphingobacteriales bacterium TSM_CSS]PSJ73968.1 hypothetical protein C7N43_26400 [Sphingobacteriales bacterium UPWRP_1]